MITSILSFFGSSAFGAMLGSVFSWLTKREEIKLQAAQWAHDEAMTRLQNEQALALASKQIEAKQEEGKTVVQGKEADAFVESLKGPSVSETVLRWVRPVLACTTLGATFWLFAKVYTLVGGLSALDAATLLAILTSIIDTVLCMASLGYSWFFGSRGSSPRLTKK